MLAWWFSLSVDKHTDVILNVLHHVCCQPIEHQGCIAEPSLALYLPLGATCRRAHAVRGWCIAAAIVEELVTVNWVQNTNGFHSRVSLTAR